MPEPRTQTSHRLNDREIARVCHEVNRAYCESLGDKSQKPWDEAEQWQKDSAVNGVLHRIESLFGGDTSGPESQHEAWMADKAKDGWTYGPVKRADLKQHPCMVPFEELHFIQQKKDALFRAVIHALAG